MLSACDGAYVDSRLEAWKERSLMILEGCVSKKSLVLSSHLGMTKYNVFRGLLSTVNCWEAVSQAGSGAESNV